MAGWARALGALVVVLAPCGAEAQFTMVPPPQCPVPVSATSTTEEAYRQEASQHLYECFPGRVYLGALPPLVYGVMTVEAEIDDRGGLVALNVVRKPAAQEIEPWLLALIRRAAPYPPPIRLPGKSARLVETFFVDRSGLFQTRSLTDVSKGVPLPAEGASTLSATTPP